MLHDVAFWLAVMCFSVAASVLVKIFAAHTTSESFQAFAAAS